MMTQLMHFYIVRGYVDGEARVIREFHDDQRNQHAQPSGTMFEIKEEVDIADIEAWEQINKRLEAKAKELKIVTLHNLYPAEDMLNAAKIGAKIRERLQSEE